MLNEALQGVVRRLLICGMHVHCEIGDEDLRIDLMNQVSYFLPHILAISGSSPFWHGDDTGLKSYRPAVFRALPRTGIPDEFNDWSEYTRHVDVLVDTGVIEDSTKLWWDIRPSARYPTIEMRSADMPAPAISMRHDRRDLPGAVRHAVRASHAEPAMARLLAHAHRREQLACTALRRRRVADRLRARRARPHAPARGRELIGLVGEHARSLGSYDIGRSRKSTSPTRGRAPIASEPSTNGCARRRRRQRGSAPGGRRPPHRRDVGGRVTRTLRVAGVQRQFLVGDIEGNTAQDPRVHAVGGGYRGRRRRLPRARRVRVPAGGSRAARWLRRCEPRGLDGIARIGRTRRPSSSDSSIAWPRPARTTMPSCARS